MATSPPLINPQAFAQLSEVETRILQQEVTADPLNRLDVFQKYNLLNYGPYNKPQSPKNKSSPKSASPKKATLKSASPKKATLKSASPKKATLKSASPKKATPKRVTCDTELVSLKDTYLCIVTAHGAILEKTKLRTMSKRNKKVKYLQTEDNQLPSNIAALYTISPIEPGLVNIGGEKSFGSIIKLINAYLANYNKKQKKINVDELCSRFVSSAHNYDVELKQYRERGKLKHDSETDEWQAKAQYTYNCTEDMYSNKNFGFSKNELELNKRQKNTYIDQIFFISLDKLIGNKKGSIKDYEPYFSYDELLQNIENKDHFGPNPTTEVTLSDVLDYIADEDDVDPSTGFLQEPGNNKTVILLDLSCSVCEDKRLTRRLKRSARKISKRSTRRITRKGKNIGVNISKRSGILV